MREGHPMTWVLDWDESDLLSIIEPYFGGTGQIYDGEDTSYPDEGKLKNAVSDNFMHGLGETVTALIDTGLCIELSHEHEFCEWEGVPHLRKGEDGKWRPHDRPERLPLMFSVQAVKS